MTVVITTGWQWRRNLRLALIDPKPLRDFNQLSQSRGDHMLPAVP
jgi:hypothetical protein